jgi:hypothetical protein
LEVIGFFAAVERFSTWSRSVKVWPIPTMSGKAVIETARDLLIQPGRFPLRLKPSVPAQTMLSSVSTASLADLGRLPQLLPFTSIVNVLDVLSVMRSVVVLNLMRLLLYRVTVQFAFGGCVLHSGQMIEPAFGK